MFTSIVEVLRFPLLGCWRYCEREQMLNKFIVWIWRVNATHFDSCQANHCEQFLCIGVSSTRVFFCLFLLDVSVAVLSLCMSVKLLSHVMVSFWVIRHQCCYHPHHRFCSPHRIIMLACSVFVPLYRSSSVMDLNFHSRFYLHASFFIDYSENAHIKDCFVAANEV